MVERHEALTKPPPIESVQPKPVHLQSLPRFALSVLTHVKRFYPSTLKESATYEALKGHGFCTESEDGGFEITAAGHAELNKKMGRPTKAKGRWAALITAYGGSRELALKVGVSYSSVKEWSVHGKEPSGPSKMMIRRLAQDAGVSSPLDD